MADLPHQERVEKAKELNKDKKLILDSIEKRKKELSGECETQEVIDMTLPIFDIREAGKFHPLCETLAECRSIFQHLGYHLEGGSCVEDDFHNFDALNMPPYHPARQDIDTFYLEDAGLLLRTHTSPVQIRFMKEHKPPFKVASVGRVFRRDSDSTHTPVFHQAEAFAVEEGLSMGHLKWTIEEFLRIFFGEEGLCLRFRPSYFPFTEPSAEVDLLVRMEKNHVQLALESEKITEQHKWIEILGCGMIHTAVFEKLGLSQRAGFAMGLGMERLAMLKYHVSDVREMFANDVQWLNHYCQRRAWKAV